MSPFVAQTANSQSARKLFGCGRADGFTHGITPRKTNPPAWMASQVLASCRQSENTTADDPGDRMRQHSAIHSEHHSTKLRSSRASPWKSLRSPRVPVCWYFTDGEALRSDLVKPPEQYGGSVSNMSQYPLGRSRRILKLSPHAISQSCDGGGAFKVSNMAPLSSCLRGGESRWCRSGNKKAAL